MGDAMPSYFAKYDKDEKVKVALSRGLEGAEDEGSLIVKYVGSHSRTQRAVRESGNKLGSAVLLREREAKWHAVLQGHQTLNAYFRSAQARHRMLQRIIIRKAGGGR